MYGKGANSFQALKEITFDMEEGEFVGIMGPSGSGKSTLLHVLATIDAPTRGDIYIGEDQLSGMKEDQLADFRRRNLGFIFQDYHLLDSLTVRENILLPLAVAKRPAAEINARVEAITAAFGIDRLLNNYPYQISGGQKQRTAACRALITDPKLLFADEPTGALDSSSATDLLDRLSAMNASQGTTIMMVTHDAFAASFCGRILFIKDGRLASELSRGSQSRKAFFQQIMDTMSSLGGVVDDAN
ncbi:hypothetical protein PA598K_03308 [Paenibacillus sp. 598K]|nr:hypothetical protein PA598K_03308 [Paenibacillus sp. 598K]